jgi:hypothetical protein
MVSTSGGGGGSLVFVITAGSRYLRKIFKNQRTAGSVYV